MSTTMSTTTETEADMHERMRLITQQYNNIDAWLYAFPTPIEFFKFFQKKLQNLSEQYGKIVEMANEYKKLAEKGIAIQAETDTLYTRIHELEDDLNVVQATLFDERENYVKLVAENEQLKLENEDYRRKFQSVLLMSKIDERDVTLFMQKNPKAAYLTDRMIEIKNGIRKCVGPQKSKYELLNPVVLEKQVKALQEQIQNMESAHRQKEYALKEQMKVMKDQKNEMVEEYETRLKRAVDCCEETKRLVNVLVIENVQLGKKLLEAEQNWVKEREKLLHLAAKSHTETVHPISTSTCITKRRVSDDSEAVKQLTQKVSLLENKLIDRENLIDEYKIKLIRLEKQAFQMQELAEQLKKMHRDDVRKLSDRNKALEKRFEEVDARRKMDNAGFREDIRALRSLLTSLERKFRTAGRKHSTATSSPSGDEPHHHPTDTAARAVSAPANFGGDSRQPGLSIDNDVLAREGLSWESLNVLLALAGKRVSQLEKKIKGGGLSA